MSEIAILKNKIRFGLLCSCFPLAFGTVLWGHWYSVPLYYQVITVLCAGFLLETLRDALLPTMDELFPETPQVATKTVSEPPAAAVPAERFAGYLYLPGDEEPKPGEICFDACMSNAAAKACRAKKLRVRTADQVGLNEASDEAHLEHALSFKAILVTHDNDFKALDASGRTHAGIVITPNEADPEEVAAFLIQLTKGAIK